MAAPEEVVAAPLTIWLAPVGTAFPDIDEAPAVDWEKLGIEGDLNYDEAGVTVSHAETVNDFKSAGSTMPQKRFRVGEDFLIKLNLVDISPATYAKVMNDAAITTVAAASGTAGMKKFSLFRGDQVASFAVLGRGKSSVDNDLNMDFVFSKAFVSVNGDAVFNKGVPVMLPVEIQAIRHSASDLIEARIQTAVALA